MNQPHQQHFVLASISNSSFAQGASVLDSAVDGSTTAPYACGAICAGVILWAFDHGSKNRPISSQFGQFNSESDGTGPSFT